MKPVDQRTDASGLQRIMVHIRNWGGNREAVSESRTSAKMRVFSTENSASCVCQDAAGTDPHPARARLLVQAGAPCHSGGVGAACHAQRASSQGGRPNDRPDSRGRAAHSLIQTTTMPVQRCVCGFVFSSAPTVICTYVHEFYSVANSINTRTNRNGIGRDDERNIG